MDDFYALQLDRMERYVCLKKSDVIIGADESSSDDDDDDEDEDEDDEDEDRDEDREEGSNNDAEDEAQEDVVAQIPEEVQPDKV